VRKNEYPRVKKRRKEKKRKEEVVPKK